MTIDEQRVPRVVELEQIVQLRRMSSGDERFVGNGKKFLFNTFIDF